MHNHSVDRDPAIESSDVKSTELIAFLTSLADISLIQSQRLSEWTGHGPAL
jgi:1,2-phenylacetyl-CoA epoxidase catalytic subunit